MTSGPVGATGEAAPSPSPGEEDPTRGGARRRARELRRRHGWLVAAAVLVLAVIVVRAFVVTPFSIPSGSMEHTLLVGDRILVTRLGEPGDLVRGDVVVFDGTRAFALPPPDAGPLGVVVGAVQGLVGTGRSTDFVKRVIGIPGDHVRCCAPDGRLEVNDTPVSEPYLKPGEEPSLTPFDVILPADRFWVMGDNRGHSADSRAHLGQPGGGMLPGEDIIGKVWVRYWPLDRLGPVETQHPEPLSSTPRNGE
ncbi:MAG: signal peptidase I [Terracoccus sp.]